MPAVDVVQPVQPGVPSSGAPVPAFPTFRLTARALEPGIRELKVEGELDLAVSGRAV